MPPLYHILIPSAVLVWDLAVVWVLHRLGRPRKVPPPNVPPMPKPSKRPWQKWDDVVDVYYDC